MLEMHPAWSFLLSFLGISRLDHALGKEEESSPEEQYEKTQGSIGVGIPVDHKGGLGAGVYSSCRGIFQRRYI